MDKTNRVYMDSEVRPLINILIRTSNRPNEFARCLRSIVAQTYPNIRIIIGYDSDTALKYIPKGLETVFVSADRSLPFYYDCYCNQLKSLVNDGWFFYLDDDDILNPNVLKDIPLNSHAIIVQLQRVNNVVPKDLNFRRGTIGMPCLILHHSLKSIADIYGSGTGDYFWIKEVISKVDPVFVPIIVVYSFGRGLGKCQ